MQKLYNMFNVNIETFIQQALEHSMPQLHRSLGAIRTRANCLGYGNRKNEDDGETYFSREINHKNRRTKDEIMEVKEFVSAPIESKNSLRTDIEVDVDIIPKESRKVEISIVDLDSIIQILTLARSQP